MITAAVLGLGQPTTQIGTLAQQDAETLIQRIHDSIFFLEVEAICILLLAREVSTSQLFTVSLSTDNTPHKSNGIAQDESSPRKDRKRKRSNSRSRSSDRRDRKKEKKDKERDRDRSRDREKDKHKDKKDKKEKTREKSRDNERHRDKDREKPVEKPNVSANKIKQMNLISILMAKSLDMPALFSSPVFRYVFTWTGTALSGTNRRGKDNLQSQRRSLWFIRDQMSPWEQLCAWAIDIVERRKHGWTKTDLGSLLTQSGGDKQASTNGIDEEIPTIEDEPCILPLPSQDQRGKQLALTRTLDSICRALDSLDGQVQRNVDKLLLEGWWDILCHHIITFCAGRKLDDEEERLFEAIVGRLGCWALQGMPCLVHGLAQLRHQKKIRGGTLPPVEALNEVLRHKLRDIPYEVEQTKQKMQLKGKPNDTREFEFTPCIEESRERIRRFLEGPDVEYRLSSIQILLSEMEESLVPENPKFCELLEGMIFDPLMQAIDCLLDLLLVCQSPQTNLIQKKLVVERNPELFSLVALKGLQSVLHIFVRKIGLIVGARHLPGEFYNVNLVGLCTTLYLLELRVEDSTSRKLKSNVDSLVEQLVVYLAKFTDNPQSPRNPSSPADRVLNHFLRLALLSTSPVKSIRLLEIYLENGTHSLPSPVLPLKTPTPVPLLFFSTERSPTYIQDNLLMQSNVIGLLLRRMVSLGPHTLPLVEQVLGILVQRGGDRVAEEVVKALEEIGRKASSLEGHGLYRFFRLLTRLAKDSLWKGLAIDSQLWGILLQGVEERLNSHKEEGLRLLSLFLRFAALMVSRQYGMHRELQERDGKTMEYLFEDLPKESLIQLMVRSVDLTLQPLLAEATQSFDQRRDLPSIDNINLFADWARFFEAMSESVIGQILLLYDHYTKHVEPVARPLASLGPLVHFYTTLMQKIPQNFLSTPHLCKGLTFLLSSIHNLLLHPSTLLARKSESRVQAIDKLLKTPLDSILALASNMFASVPISLLEDTIPAQVLLSSIRELVDKSTAEGDVTANPPYKNNRDFTERHKKWVKALEYKEENFKKKLQKKLTVSGQFGPLLRVIAGELNGQLSDGRLEEDWLGQAEIARQLDKLKTYSAALTSGEESTVWTSMRSQLLAETVDITEDSYGDPSLLKAEDKSTPHAPSAKGEISLSAFKDVTFHSTHRLLESRTFVPNESKSSYQPNLMGSSLASSANVLPKVSSTRAASTHVDDFKIGGSAATQPPGTAAQQTQPPQTIPMPPLHAPSPPPNVPSASPNNLPLPNIPKTHPLPHTAAALHPGMSAQHPLLSHQPGTAPPIPTAYSPTAHGHLYTPTSSGHMQPHPGLQPMYRQPAQFYSPFGIDPNQGFLPAGPVYTPTTDMSTPPQGQGGLHKLLSMVRQVKKDNRP